MTLQSVCPEFFTAVFTTSRFIPEALLPASFLDRWDLCFLFLFREVGDGASPPLIFPSAIGLT
ncbi:MAG: hypothetical protein NTX84_09045 [Nitrospirae bacterium]|nr:hypothetical protein [Nitrospirota bacterium]